MLSNLIGQVQMLIDRIFLGHLDVLYVSAVGNATTPVWTTMSVIFSLTMGASILISQAVGREDMEEVHKLSSSLLVFNNVLPVLLFFFWTFASPLVFKLMGVSQNLMKPCLTYTRIYAPCFLFLGIGAGLNVVMQTSGNTKPLLWFGIVRALLNIFLDYALIFGHFGFPAMGITGAALATTIAEVIGFVCSFIIVIRNKNLFTRPPLKSIFHATLRPYITSVKLGINTALEDFAWNFGNLVIIRVLNSINELAAGIYTIVYGIEVIAVVVIGSIGNATMTLTGEATGAKDLPLYRKIVKTSLLWSFIVSGFTLLMAILFPQQILSWFTKDINIITTSAVYLTIVGINLFGKSGNIIVGCGIRGYGNTRWMFFTQIFGTISIITMAILFVNVFHFGMIGVFFAIMVDEYSRATINYIRYRKIKF